MDHSPDVSIIVLSCDTRDLLMKCLESVYAHGNGESIELFVVDNASADGSPDEVAARYPQARLIRNSENVGFARANNQAIPQAKGRYVLLLNSDAELPGGALRGMIDFVDAHPEAGAVGPRLVYADGTAQPSVDAFPNLLTEFAHLFNLKSVLPTPSLRKKVAERAGSALGRTVGTYLAAYEERTDPVEVDCASGGCLLVRKDVIERVGLLDENFFIYMEDMDWCIRMKEAGFKTYFLPGISVVHHVSASVTATTRAREKGFLARYRGHLYFFEKHRGQAAQLLLRAMMAGSFSLRWLFLFFMRMSSSSRGEAKARQSMYGKVIRLALK